MLAPRKTLWSTPLSAVDQLQNWISLQDNDKVCDIGCGDGRIILEWAQRLSTQPMVPKVSFVGIDIDSNRIELCKHYHHQLEQSTKIHENISIEFICGNALESSHYFNSATIVFLYLIPRGLKLIHPILKQHKSTMQERPLHVVSYMSKLPDEKAHDRALLQVEHQPGAAWPLYYYIL